MRFFVYNLINTTQTHKVAQQLCTFGWRSSGAFYDIAYITTRQASYHMRLVCHIDSVKILIDLRQSLYKF